MTRNNSATSSNKAIIESGRDPTSGRFLTANNVGPGRPKGSRNRLTTEFLDGLYAEFQVSGAAAIKKVAEREPAKFLTLIATLLPKELDVALTANVLRDAQDFAQAFRMARSITAEADAMPLLELQASEVPDESD